MRLANQKILVTGGTGFIGGHVVRRLLTAGQAAVRVMARDPAKAGSLSKLGAEIIEGDVTDQAAASQAVQGCSLVVHAAAQVAAAPQREIFESTNAGGTESMLRAAAEARVARFVHLSSVAVFGLPASGEVTDQSPRGTCGDPYCDTKYDAEERVLRFSRESSLPVTILRPSAVYGPGSTHWSLIPLKRIKKGRMFLVDGGLGLLNYVYIDNLVDAILLGVEDDRAANQAFIVNDGTTTWREFFGAYALMAGKNGIRSAPLWMAKFYMRYRNLAAAARGQTARIPVNALRFVVGTAVYRQTHIEERLGHRSRINLQEGMRRTEAWFREVGLL